MPDASDLMSNDQLLASAIVAFPKNVIVDCLAQCEDQELAAGAAIAAGIHRIPDATKHLIDLIDDDTLTARCAAWALSQIPSERELCSAISNGSLDQREHGYLALAGLAAQQMTSSKLPEFLQQQLNFELDRASQGFTGLGEQVCRIMAILGLENTNEAITQVIDKDPQTDRFELQRIRKQLSNGSQDLESINELTADWQIIFEDDLAPEPQDTAADADDDESSMAPGPETTAAESPTEEPPTNEQESQQAEPIDWAAFMESPEATGLDETSQGLIKQLGPMLEQLVARMTGMPLTQLSGQELAGLLLQVLPQALPPQSVQAALSPQAINGYQALAKYLVRNELVSPESDLLDGVKLVREQLQESVRSSGMLGGPDYSDPDEKVAK